MYGHLKCVVLLLAMRGIAFVASEETRSAFIIIDVQDCFLPGGSLAVDRGDTILPVINGIRKNNTFDAVVFSLDWHPPGHVSFASAHNKAPFDVITLGYLHNGTLCLGETVTPRAFPGALNCTGSSTKTLNQTVYPVHCVQNVTQGPTSSMISGKLVRYKDDLLIHKGVMKQIDSYSAFFDNGKFFDTNLDSELKRRKINTVFVAGFALDICVFHTSMDARDLGYNTYVVTDASLGINPQHVVNAQKKLINRGVKLISHAEIPAILKVKDSSNFPGPALTLMFVLLLTPMQFIVI
ncbi:unnamed protein product [Candidula unifasciata]|uniref:nicotinamidase n=1 Tax=Candidula unifasciata TaxID=100452 RepID=A0A8S3YQ93_9EUPU|nr:unnamed protein product [Candidula unifasciata]